MVGEGALFSYAIKIDPLCQDRIACNWIKITYTGKSGVMLPARVDETGVIVNHLNRGVLIPIRNFELLWSCFPPPLCFFLFTSPLSQITQFMELPQYVLVDMIVWQKNAWKPDCTLLIYGQSVSLSLSNLTSKEWIINAIMVGKQTYCCK